MDGNELDAAISPSQLNPLSLFSVRVDQYLGGQRRGHGTGFFVSYLQRTFLVTCYHVLTAREPKNPNALLPGHFDSPDELRWRLIAKSDSPVWFPREGSIRLREDEQFLEHRRRAEGLDLVALPFEVKHDASIFSHPFATLQTSITQVAGDELSIVGFPFDEQTDRFLPIWKRASVASEPASPTYGKGRFLVDSLSTPGMSGSPVYAAHLSKMVSVSAETQRRYDDYQNGAISASDFILNLDPEEISGPSFDKRHFRFAGVYCGRLTDGRSESLSLGIVCGAASLIEMLESPAIVGHPFPRLP